MTITGVKRKAPGFEWVDDLKTLLLLLWLLSLSPFFLPDSLSLFFCGVWAIQLLFIF